MSAIYDITADVYVKIPVDRIPYLLESIDLIYERAYPKIKDWSSDKAQEIKSSHHALTDFITALEMVMIKARRYPK